MSWVQRQIEVGRTDINIVRHLRQKGVDDATVRTLGNAVGRSFDPDEAYWWTKRPKPVSRPHLITYLLSGAGLAVVLVGMRMAVIPRETPFPPWFMLLLAALSGAVAGALFLILEPRRYSRRDAGSAYWLIGTVTAMVFLLPTFFTIGGPITLSIVLASAILCAISGFLLGLYLRYMAQRGRF